PRIVAIKTALAEEAASEDFWKVLLDEARIASQIQHPNVCSIHALDRERGVVYLVMDYSDGGSLRELLDAEPSHRLQATFAARIVARVAAGLHAAHELVDQDGSLLGVVHRDVSPQNILISAAGQVKIADFGVAKARGQLHAPTQTGEVKGKLSYMAPEQVTTRDVDRRADVFALGCVLFEASTGERPFHGSDALATLYQLLEQPIKRPSELLPSYPPGLEKILLRALDRDPDARYQTAEEMERALETWLASERAMVSEPDIAEVVRGALGAHIDARAESIRNAIQTLDTAPHHSVTPTVPTRPGIETLSGAASSTVPEAPATLPQPAPKRFPWAVPLIAAAVIAGFVLVISRGKAPPVAAVSSAPLSAPKVEAAPVTPEAPRVRIAIRAQPEEAAISIDDGPPVPSPYALEVQPEARVHRIRVSLAGYRERTEQIVFDASKEVAVLLEPEARPGRKAALRSAVVSSVRPNNPSVTNPEPAESPQPAPAPSRKVGELPTLTKKPPRVLDSDNPFAAAEKP
ncbi:MAG TPA: protein kinase, partial [Polyangiaceae bacterium]|nr:protein kinase [Polyangiaceae bacterium]